MVIHSQKIYLYIDANMIRIQVSNSRIVFNGIEIQSSKYIIELTAFQLTYGRIEDQIKLNKSTETNNDRMILIQD